jgi:hypothetical protein
MFSIRCYLATCIYLEKDMPNINLCPICDNVIFGENRRVTLHALGIREPLDCHDTCVDAFYACKGDFNLLPDGKLRRALQRDTPPNDTIIKVTAKKLTTKQVFYIMGRLAESRESGMSAIYGMAVNFYGLPKPNEANLEYYTVDKDAQLILMQKANLIIM